jgi:hypothetical protein
MSAGVDLVQGSCGTYWRRKGGRNADLDRYRFMMGSADSYDAAPH